MASDKRHSVSRGGFGIMLSTTGRKASMAALLVVLAGFAAGPVDATYESTPTKTLPGSPAVFDAPGVMWIFHLPAGMGNYLVAPAGDWSCRDNNAGTSVG